MKTEVNQKRFKMEDLIDELRQELIKTRDNPPIQLYPAYLEQVIQYFERVMRAKEEGKLVAGHCVLAPTELFYAMDIVPLHLENFALFLNFFEDLRPYLDLAASHGLRPEICSAHRVTDAMVIDGAFPQPDFFVYTSQVCDNTPKSGESMAEMAGAPAYFLDRPYKYNERSLEYYTEEMADLVRFLEEQTGKKLDLDRLKEVLDNSYRLTELCTELDELRKAVPTPMPCEGLFAEMALFWLLPGLPIANTMMEQLLSEMRQRVEKGIGAIPNERHRIFLSFFLPTWDMDVMSWMEERHGAVTVQFPSSAWSGKSQWLVDRDKPLENLARRTFVHPGAQQFHGPMVHYIDDTIKNVRDYKADGAIFFAHIGCRQACACIRAIKDALVEDLGVPSVVVDCDLIDKSFTTPEEVRDKLDGFFERLEEGA